jgi:cell wall assembly regulator SMI1
MTELSVERSWDRIDAWLVQNAPKTYATLRPPADEESIAAAAQALGIEFPADLVASLRRHDGATKYERHRFTFAGGDRPLGVEDLLHHGRMFQGLWNEDDDPDLLDGYYWHPKYLMFADTVSADGLVLDCRPGESFGAVGDHFKGEGTRFGQWSSLAGMLYELAGALEQGVPMGWPLKYLPIAFGGELIWEKVKEPLPAPRSLLELAAAEQTPVPPERDHGRFTPASETGWAGEYGTFCLSFVHGVDADELLRRFGALTDTRAPRTRTEANEQIRRWTGCGLPVVRAGQAGEWAVGIEEGHWEGVRGEVLRRLSRGTRAVSLFFSGFTQMSFYENGALVTVFDSRRSYQLAGEADPYQIFPGLPEAGGLVDRDLMRAVCAVLTAELGIDLAPDALGGGLISAQLLPVLGQPACLERPTDEFGDTLARAPEDRLRSAMALQMTRLASETGLDVYPEVAQALTRVRRGERWSVDDDSPLGLRLRTVAAEHHAAGRVVTDQNGSPLLEHYERRGWQQLAGAADALLATLQLPPRQAAGIVLHQRLDPHWRDEFVDGIKES